MEECWREVYHFGKGGGGLAGRMDEYVKECFKDLPSPKDGYSIDDCKDPRHKRLLAFLVLIVYPEKPNRITVTWDNTIFGALNGGWKVNWARVITTLVVQLAARVGKSRATPICPFFYHLYERKELLKPEEEKQWKIQEAMMKYGESGSEDEARSASGSDDEDDEEEEEEEENAGSAEPASQASKTGGQVGTSRSDTCSENGGTFPLIRQGPVHFDLQLPRGDAGRARAKRGAADERLPPGGMRTIGTSGSDPEVDG
jgi:hypothetical protein